MPLLSAVQRKNLKQYKYSGVDHSLVSRYVLQPYWNWLVKLFPLWIAPNLITLTGLGFTLVSFAILLYYSPDLAEPCPNWAYFVFGVNLFIYQSLDAIDGKQARRTGSSGPLGELFDHGCDALNLVFMTILGSSSFNLHQGWWLIMSIIIALANFYLSTWEEFHTGTLYLSPCSGPVEGIIIAIITFFIAGFYGPEVYENTFHWLLPTSIKSHPLASQYLHFIPDFQLKHGFVIFGMVFCAVNIILGLINVRKATRSSQISIWRPVMRLMPFVYWCTIFVAWCYVSPIILQHHSVALCVLFGIAHGYQVGQMIIGHLTKSGFPYFTIPLSLLLPGGLIITTLHQLHQSSQLTPALARYILKPYASQAYIHITNLLTQGQTLTTTICKWIGLPPVSLDVALVYALLVVVSLWYFIWALRVISDMCELFDIYCLSIKKKPVANGIVEKKEN